MAVATVLLRRRRRCFIVVVVVVFFVFTYLSSRPLRCVCSVFSGPLMTRLLISTNDGGGT